MNFFEVMTSSDAMCEGEVRSGVAENAGNAVQAGEEVGKA